MLLANKASGERTYYIHRWWFLCKKKVNNRTGVLIDRFSAAPEKHGRRRATGWVGMRGTRPFLCFAAYNEILWFPTITTPHTQMMRISNTALDTRFLIKKRYRMNNNNVIDFLYGYWFRYSHVRCQIDKVINYISNEISLSIFMLLFLDFLNFRGF